LIIAAVRSVVTYVAVSVYVLFAASIGMLLEMIFRWKGILYILGHGGVRLGLALAGIKVRVAGREHLPLDRAAVYCANHESNVDPPVLFTSLHPRMHIVYKAEINAIPLLARAFQHGGFVPIERRNKEAAMRSLEAGARSIQSGNSFLIFPEGTRSKTGEMLPFKKGGFLMALKAQAPIVPVAISGGRDAMRRGSAIIRPVTVTIRVGAPVETAGMQMTDRDTLIATVRERIEGLLAQGPVVD
jgi:1-acyl-sn-glycerol-3-phosphate acyltransferase